MANKKELDKLDSKLTDISQKTSAMINGIDDSLDDQNDNVKNIIRQTIIGASKKIGTRTGKDPVDYMKDFDFPKIFADDFQDNSATKASLNGKNPEEAFKKFMENDANLDVSKLMVADADEHLLFSNYKIFYSNIPECSAALDTYKDNIMSPDDFTKMIFRVTYDEIESSDDKIEELVKNQLNEITEKYEIEDKADSIIEQSLMLGKCYVSVMSLEKELNKILNDPIMIHEANTKGITEDSLASFDVDLTSMDVEKEDFSVSKSLTEAFDSVYKLGDEHKLNEEETKNIIINSINNNVELGSKKEFLLERVLADRSYSSDSMGIGGVGFDISDIDLNNRQSDLDNKKSDSQPLYINGSSLKILDPSRVIELKVDDIVYGYYFVTPTDSTIPDSPYLGASSGRNTEGSVGVASNLTVATTGRQGYTPNDSAASSLGVSEPKLQLITDIFINTLSKKINKPFIRKNKEFKEFIYSLVKQDYIIKKGIKFIYFGPNDIVKFEVPPLYRKITFMAKMYLAVLTDNILVKLGRSHDKRIFYVNTGLDAAYEGAINKVIYDVKTKDYKMDDLNDVNSILNLNPGRWDDYFMPSFNGDRPVEIDTLAGMDVEMNGDFMEFLKNSMMSGMGVPRDLIDTTASVDFARSISAQNAQFTRSVIKYQKLLTAPFTKLYRILYTNEYKFSGNKKSNVESIININNIHIEFPSPTSLIFEKYTAELQTADGNAEIISKQLYPMLSDGSNADKRANIAALIVKDMLPGIDWEKYEELAREAKIDKIEQSIKNSNPEIADKAVEDPYAGY